MTGDWLTVKWIVLALLALSGVCALFALARLDGEAERRAKRISVFMLTAFFLAKLVRDVFENAGTTRAFYIFVGFVSVGAILALLSLLVRKAEEVSLKADG